MKFQNKTLLVALATAALLQLTAGVAQAYYNPQTGRWLSRDPVGEPGFQVVRAASGAAQGAPLGAAPVLPQSRWFQRDSELHSGPNLYGFVRNGPISHWDSLGLLTATGGAPHTSLIEHNNYLVFTITCPKCTELLVNSVDYRGALSGLHALGLDDDMLSDAFGGFSGASDLGGMKDVKTPNCRGKPVKVRAYMRTRLSNQVYLDAMYVALHTADGFPKLNQSQTVGAYAAGTTIDYDCVPCGGSAMPWWP